MDEKDKNIEKKIQYSSLKDIPASTWKKLSEKKIYFGHQSVGYNILDGIKDIMKQYPEIKINIVEGKTNAKKDQGVFLHSQIGKNGNPSSKIHDFVNIMEGGIGGNADVAFMKFCYVDIKPNTDVEKVFDEYKKAMREIKDRYHDIKIIHFTVPLTTIKKSWKTWLKELIGKEDIWEYDVNIKRNEYNEMLNKEFNGKEPVFDIAKIESTYKNGERAIFERNGKKNYMMVPEYTDDGGHLNKIGRKIVGEKLLLQLVNLQ